MIVKWSESEIAAMPVERARELSEQVKSTMVAASDSADTFRLLRRLDQRIGQAPATVEQRAASARDFLYGTRDPGVAARAWAMAVELCGSEKEAERRGHKRPA
jgi:hypothetical protein